MKLGVIGDFKYFSWSEFDSPDSPGSGEKYMNYQFVKQLDEAREISGVPFKINSGYRTPDHNAKVGGVKNSAHTKGLAADIACSGETCDKIVKALIKVGFTRIGVASSFIHVDMDTSKSQYAAWKYTSTGRVPVPFETLAT